MLTRSKSHQAINSPKTQMVILRISRGLTYVSASVRNCSVPQSQGPQNFWILPPGTPPGFHRGEARKILLGLWEKREQNNNFEIDKGPLSDKAILFKRKALPQLYFSYVEGKFLNPRYFWASCLTEGEESLKIHGKSQPRDI